MEWQRLATRRASVSRARSWGLAVDITSLDDVVLATGWYDSAHGRLGTATPTAPVSQPIGHRNVVAGEAVMHRLLLAAQHDDLAARVVLQASRVFTKDMGALLGGSGDGCGRAVAIRALQAQTLSLPPLGCQGSLGLGSAFASV